jgi:hypothetical protein
MFHETKPKNIISITNQNRVQNRCEKTCVSLCFVLFEIPLNPDSNTVLPRQSKPSMEAASSAVQRP